MNPLDQLCDEIANLHLLADRLASRSPSHDLVEAADAMRDQFVLLWQDAHPGSEWPSEVDAYDASRTRHAEGAKPSGAPEPASYGGIPIVSDPSLRPGEIIAVHEGDEVGRIVVEHAGQTESPATASAQGDQCTPEDMRRVLSYFQPRRVGPASAQGEVCECGHGRAMHFDEDGDHNGACLYQMNDKPFCRCDMFRAKDKERA